MRYPLLFFTAACAFLVLLVLMCIDLRDLDFDMLALSVLLFYILTWVIMEEKNKMSPLVFFSLLFYGYVLSGIYFALYDNIEYAKFFEIVGRFSTEDLKVAISKVLVGYVCFVAGYKLISGKNVKKINLNLLQIDDRSTKLKVFLVSLFFLSFAYWVYVSFLLAGGPFALLENMGIYLVLLEDNPVSTAPYLLAYATISVLFILQLKARKKIPYYLILLIFLSFLMSVSTARLAGSVFYLLSFPLMYWLYYGHTLNGRALIGVMTGAFFLGALYFYRYYSNLEYLGISIDGDVASLVGEHLFGKTNIGDLQSLVFAEQYTEEVGYLFGKSFSDLFTLWVSKFTLENPTEISIGVRLREYFFSHVDTGAPAPGVISEMIMNFGFFGLTLGMAILGGMVRIFSEMLVPSRSLANLYVYTHFLLFLTLLAKVDSTHISSFVWTIIPFMVFAIFLSLLTKLGVFSRHKMIVGVLK